MLSLLFGFKCYICYCYSSDEPVVRLNHKVSASLKQALEKLKLSENKTDEKGGKRAFAFACFIIFNIFPLFQSSFIHSVHVMVGMKVTLTVKFNGWHLGYFHRLCHSHQDVWNKDDTKGTAQCIFNSHHGFLSSTFSFTYRRRWWWNQNWNIV